MARGKKEQKATPIDFKAIVWVLNNLTETELEEMDGSGVSMGDVLDGIYEMIEDGWKVSIRHDDYSDSPMVSAVNLDGNNLNGGFGMSSRSSELGDALKILYWKFFKVANRDLSEFKQEVKRVRG